MRVLGLMVMKNEADRYLRESLSSLKAVCDLVMVYDDQSTDESVITALGLGSGISVFPRPDIVPSFEEHEGQFRQAAWDALGTLDPTDDDWIVSLDADEILYVFPELFKNLDGIQAVDVPIHEVFEIDGEDFLIRTDGFWGNISGVRLCRWQEGGKFADKDMASGSLPTYAMNSAITVPGIEILHLGYVRQEDRNTKHERYKNRSGHNPKHVDSILKSGTLVPWKPLV